MSTETQEIVEYRARGERHGIPTGVRCSSLAHAKARSEEMQRGSQLVTPFKNVRIEKRTVTYGPWEANDE